MRASRTARRALFATVALALSIGGSLALGMSSQAATDPTPGTFTIDTTSRTLVTDNTLSTLGKTGGDECIGDKCKKLLNWCSQQGETPVEITEDAPMTLGDEKDGVTKCKKDPLFEGTYCIRDGKCDYDIKASNPNHRGAMRIRIKKDTGDWIDKWVPAKGSVIFSFKDVSYGEATFTIQVWAGGKKWCEYKVVKILIKCASPSPSTSPSPSLSPSPEVSETEQSPPPGGGLPQTGAPVLGMLLTGGGTIAAGGLALFFARRRRDDFGAEA